MTVIGTLEAWLRWIVKFIGVVAPATALFVTADGVSIDKSVG